MKKINKQLVAMLITIISLLSLTTESFAQTVIGSGSHKINNVSYDITQSSKYPFYSIVKSTIPSLPRNREIVNNIPLQYIDVKISNEFAWKQLIIDTLGAEKVKALKQRNESIGLIFYLKPDGSILFLNYMIGTSTILTLNDIAKIDQTLTEKYNATFTSRDNGHQYLYWIAINSELNFSQ